MSQPASRCPVTGDAVLVAALASGDLSSLGRLFDLHATSVRRFVLRLGVRPSDADDLVQEVFLDALKAASAFDSSHAVRPWLLGLATMIVRRHRRSISRMAARIASWAWESKTQPQTPEEALESSHRAARMQRALTRLSQRKREVFLLVAVEGLSGDEAAAALGIPVGTVWTRLHHARRELMQRMEDKRP
ncbi:MAG: RNA polymerase sigma factor [Deltaproteobacteria bacterium]|nr:RNA polymerase sigma factor [Deltaproteobacteria bacterium]